MDFQISLSLWELQVIRDWLCVRDIAETSLNRLLLLLILKSSHRVCSIEKGALKNFTGKHFCWNLFLRLHESHNALKFPGSFFSFFFSWVCQGHPEYQEFWEETILQNIEQLIQYLVLEIYFRPLKYMTVIRIRKNLSNIPFLYKR